MKPLFENELLHAFAFKQINDKFWGIKVPVSNVFGFQTLYVAQLEPDFFRIHDGGETLGTVAQATNILSKAFETKLFEICKARKISKNGNILSIDCTAANFSNCFFALFGAITLIHA